MMKYYVISTQFGINGWTDDEKVVDRILNSTSAKFLTYTVETRYERPQFLDRLY